MVLKKLFKGLTKTREKLSRGLKGLFALGRDLDDAFIEELEEVLYTADMGSTAIRVIEEVRAAYKKGDVKDTEGVYRFLKDRLRTVMEGENGGETGIRLAETPPTVILVAGVNGSGKTTSIAKLGHHFKRRGKKVILGACDTFRAAAVEQLTLWSERIGVELVKKETGADPAAAAYDAAKRAVETGAEILIVDTAGRLHTQENLMQELEKIRRVLGKVVPGAPHEVLLVLDATTGQNAVVQAEKFGAAVDVTGLFLAKLDGTAKGGAVVTIREKIRVPVKFVGVGEQVEDIEPFDAAAFVEALFA